MSGRRPFLAGNWKMQKTAAQAADFARTFRALVREEVERDVALFPPFLALGAVLDTLAGSAVRVGAQNCHFEAEGAFTGEVSPGMLVAAGCGLVLVGHSERRAMFGETNEVVAKKLRAALRAGLDAILCVGETIEERRADRTEVVVGTQLAAAVAGLAPAELDRVTLAYEPIWAIGTGLTATPGQAQAVHAYLRGELARIHGSAAADSMRIQYGGSVKPDNIGGLMDEPDIDGALVGGASLDPEGFAAIVRYGRG